MTELGDNFLREVVIVSSVVVLEWNSVQEILGIAANKKKCLTNDISNGFHQGISIRSRTMSGHRLQLIRNCQRICIIEMPLLNIPIPG